MFIQLFSGLNYHINVLSDVSYKHTNKLRLRSLPPLMSKKRSSSTSSLQTSSHPVITDEYQKIYSSALSQENTVGIIGGVSVLSTLIFLEKLVWWSSKDRGTSVPFIVCSEKCIFSGLDQQRAVVENLRRKRKFLEEGGAKCIVMPCHVSHGWYSEISQGCKLPFLHVAECVALELKRAMFKPLEAGSGVKIGVVATDATLMAGIYQDKLQSQGFEVVFPDKATMEHIVNPAIKSLNRKDKEGAINLLRIAIQVLLVKAVNTVILASDELQGLLPHDDPLVKKCIDPMDVLARSAVRWAKSAKHN